MHHPDIAEVPAQAPRPSSAARSAGAIVPRLRRCTRLVRSLNLRRRFRSAPTGRYSSMPLSRSRELRCQELPRAATPGKRRTRGGVSAPTASRARPVIGDGGSESDGTPRLTCQELGRKPYRDGLSRHLSDAASPEVVAASRFGVTHRGSRISAFSRRCLAPGAGRRSSQDGRQRPP